MNDDTRRYLLETDVSELSSNDKRLRTMLIKYGSIQNAYINRDVTKMSEGGKKGGKARVPKGFARMDKARVRELSKKAHEAKRSKNYGV